MSGGLEDRELAQQSAEALPEREQLSLLTTGGGMGLVDAGATTSGATEAGGGTDSGVAGTADGYAEPAQQHADGADDLAAAAPTENSGDYSPQQTATAAD